MIVCFDPDQRPYAQPLSYPSRVEASSHILRSLQLPALPDLIVNSVTNLSDKSSSDVIRANWSKWNAENKKLKNRFYFHHRCVLVNEPVGDIFNHYRLCLHLHLFYDNYEWKPCHVDAFYWLLMRIVNANAWVTAVLRRIVR